jgi:hypothetical protein
LVHRHGRPTRRIRESCLSESSGISEKLIFFDSVFFYFFPAGPLRADDPCDFFIASSPYPIRYNQEGLKWTQTFFESFESIDVALRDVATRMYRRK